MIEAVVETEGKRLETIQGLLAGLLEKGVVDALLMPMRLPGGTVAPMLVSEPAALERADPLAPVLPINAARAVSNLTGTGHSHKLGAVLRACEIRALVELVKFQQANLDNSLLIGVDCLGTYSVTSYQALEDKEQAVEELLEGATTGQVQPGAGLAFRSACQLCDQPLPQGEHVGVTIGLLGMQRDQLYLKVPEEVAEALDLMANGSPPGRQEAIQKLVSARSQARSEAFAEFRSQVDSMDGLLEMFSTCIRCHNCMTNCPICYCRECIFRTPTFEHESQLFYQWAERKGTVRMLPDTLLFHLTRLNHMVSSCVSCGMCSDVCPVEIPVSLAFGAVGEKVQAIFDYHPGRSLEEAAPVQEFREDELTAMGERPHG